MDVDKKIAKVGDELTYTISCINDTDQIQQNIGVEVLVPENTMYIEGSATGEPSFDGKKLSWMVKSLPPHSTENYSFKVKITSSNSGRTIAEGDYTYNNLRAKVEEVKTYTIVPPLDWVVIYYMDYDNDLYPWLWQDWPAVGSTDKVAILMEVDLPDVNGICINGVGNILVRPSQDTSDPNLLIDLIKFANQNLPANHHILTIWDHGSGRKREERLKTHRWIAGLTTAELRKALESGGVKFDIIGLEACLMQMVEVATEIKEWTDIVCGSEEIGWTGRSGIDYALSALVDTPSMDVMQFAKIYVESSSQTTWSAVYTSHLAELADAINALGKKLDSLYPSDKIDSAILATAKFYYPEYKDLFGFARNVIKMVPEATSEAERVLSLKDKVVLFNHTYMETEGISITLPQVPSQDPWEWNYYKSLIFGQLAPCWANFIYQAPTISITKTASKKVALKGDTLNYTITIKNDGSKPAYELDIFDQIPENTEFVEGSASPDANYDSGKRELSWHISTLDPNASTTFSFKVKILTTGEIANTAETNCNYFSFTSNTTRTEAFDMSILSPIPNSKVGGWLLLSASVSGVGIDTTSVRFYIDNQQYQPTFAKEDIYYTLVPSLSVGQHTIRVEAKSGSGVLIQSKTYTFTVVEIPELTGDNIYFISLPFTSDISLNEVIATTQASALWKGSKYDVIENPASIVIPACVGVWLKTVSSINAKDITFNGSLVSPSEEASIFLGKGWQAIGLPWTYPLPISALQIEDKNGNRFSFSQASNLVGKVLFRWNGTEYVNVGLQQGMENTLYPWFGYWIRVKDDCKLIFPKEPWTVQAKRASNLDGFCLPIKAVFSDGTTEDVYIGIGKEEITSPFPPPAPYSQNLKRLSIIKNGELLYIDIRKEGGKQEWRLAVKGGATLFFPNLSYLPKGWQAILTDGDKRYYLKTTSAVKVEGEKELKVEIGDGLVTPLLINMVEARSVRGGVNISWNVNLPCQAKVAIKGADGRVLRDLGMRSSSSGLNSIFWDGKGQDGRNLPAGIYIIELTARDELNQMVRAIKMVNLR